MNIVAVCFEKGGREYYYKTPYVHVHNTYLMVCVAGQMKVVQVVEMVDEDDISFSGPLKTIEGVIYTMADLEQPIVTPKPTLFQTLANHFASR